MRIYAAVWFTALPAFALAFPAFLGLAIGSGWRRPGLGFVFYASLVVLSMSVAAGVWLGQTPHCRHSVALCLSVINVVVAYAALVVTTIVPAVSLGMLVRRAFTGWLAFGLSFLSAASVLVSLVVLGEAFPGI